MWSWLYQTQQQPLASWDVGMDFETTGPWVMWKDMRAPSCRSSTLGSGGNFEKGTNQKQSRGLDQGSSFSDSSSRCLLIQRNNASAYVYSRWITLLQLLDPWCLSPSQYLLRNSIGGNNKQSWSIKTQVVSTCIDNKPMSTASSSLQKISCCPFHIPPLLQQVASAPISQHPIGTRVSEEKLSTQFHSCILQWHFWPKGEHLTNGGSSLKCMKRSHQKMPRGSIEDEGSGTQPWPPHHLLGGFASFASLASLASFVSLASATA